MGLPFLAKRSFLTSTEQQIAQGLSCAGQFSPVLVHSQVSANTSVTLARIFQVSQEDFFLLRAKEDVLSQPLKALKNRESSTLWT